MRVVLQEMRKTMWGCVQVPHFSTRQSIWALGRTSGHPRGRSTRGPPMHRDSTSSLWTRIAPRPLCPDTSQQQKLMESLCLLQYCGVVNLSIWAVIYLGIVSWRGKQKLLGSGGVIGLGNSFIFDLYLGESTLGHLRLIG